MKKAFKKFTLLAVIAAAAIVLVGCNKTITTTAAETTVAPTITVEPTTVVTEKTDLSVLGGFQASDEGVYTVATDSASDLHFTYAKSKIAGAYLKKAVSGLADYNTLAITVKAAGTFKLALVYGDNEIAVSLASVADNSVYNWGFTANDKTVLSKVTEIRIYAAPGKEALTGELEFTVLNFTTKVAGANGEFIINSGYNNIPSNAIEYANEEKVNVLAKFVENDKGTYAFTYNADGSVKIDYTKGQGFEWAYFKNEFSGMPTDFTAMTLVVKGKKGTKVLIKPDDNDGGDNWYVIQADDKEETIYVPITAGVRKILWFVQAGVQSTGSITFVSGVISKGTVTKTALGKAISGYSDSGDGSYAISEKEGTAVVTYSVKAHSWNTFNFLASSASDAGLSGNSLKVTVQGKSGDQVLVKLNDSLETWYTLTSADPESFVIKGDKLPTYLTKSYIFINPNQESDQNGTLTIRIEVVETPKDAIYYKNEVAVDANGYYKDGGDSAYTFLTNADKSVTITVNKSNQYSWFANEFVGFDDAVFAKMVMVVKSSKDATLGIKPNDSNDYMDYKALTADQVQVIEFKVPVKLAKIIYFFDINEAASSATFTIYSAYLVNEGDEITNIVSNDPGIYTFASNTLTYAKVSGGEWSCAKAEGLTISAGSVIGAVVKGKAGDQIMLKINDSKENWFTLTGELQLLVTTVNPTDAITSVVIFCEPGKASVSGSVYLKLFSLAPGKALDINIYASGDSLNINNYWADLGDNAYSFSKDATGAVAVSVSKAKGEWSCFSTKIQGIDAQFNLAAVQIKGTKDVQLLLKFNNTEEHWVTMTGEEQTIYVPFAVTGMTSMYIFYAGGKTLTEDASFTITKFVLVNGSVVAQDAYVTNFATRESVTVVANADLKSIDCTFKHASGDWGYIIAGNYGDCTGLSLQVTVKSDVATKLLVKINDKIETWVDVTAAGTTVTISGGNLPADFQMTKILLFIDGGVASDTQGTCNISLKWVKNA